MNPIERINLSKLRRCNQYWDEMQPIEGGRLCEKCQNKIIDFRNLSDREIAEIHLQSERPVCGLYRKSQLAPPSTQGKGKRTNKWKSIYLGILGLVMARTIYAQTTADSIRIEQLENSIADSLRQIERMEKNKSIRKAQDSLIITGRLSEYGTQEPLIGATIQINDTTWGTSSDMNGNYRLNVTEYFKTNSQLTLSYHYTGYKTHRETLTQTDSLILDVQLKVQDDLGLIDFGIVVYPWHRRVWLKIKNLFRRKRFNT